MLWTRPCVQADPAVATRVFHPVGDPSLRRMRGGARLQPKELRMRKRDSHLDKDCLLTGRLTVNVRGNATRKCHTVDIRGCGFV